MYDQAIIEKFLKQGLYDRALLINKKENTYAYRTRDAFGVLIPYCGNDPVKLRFSAACLEDLLIDGEYNGRYLYFSCSDEKLISKFSLMCVDFLQKENIKKIQCNPMAWWEEWKDLMGNVIADSKVYSTIGELIVYLGLIKHGVSQIIWGGPDSSSHDLETPTSSYEVKSTIKRYGRVASIAGEHQLLNTNGKLLYLVFLRLEPCINGGLSLESCVNSITDQVLKKGVQKKLEKLHIEPGTPHYKDEYTLHEAYIYLVDDGFPRITMDKLNTLISNNRVQEFSYVLNLAGLGCEDYLNYLLPGVAK